MKLSNKERMIKRLENKIEKKFAKLCKRAKYLTGQSTDDILYDLRAVGLLLDLMLTKHITLDRDYYEILVDIYECETLNELENLLREIASSAIQTQEDREALAYELDKLRQKYTLKTSVTFSDDGTIQTDDNNDDVAG